MNAHAPLVHYNAACVALAAAKSTDEVKDWRDKAEAMRAYAHQSKNRQLEIDAAEIRIRAERRLGQLIAEQKETVGLATGGKPYQSTGSDTAPVETRAPTLAEIGVDKKLSSHSQKVAAIPEDDFENIVDEWRDSLETANERVTTNILAAADKAAGKPHVANSSGNNEWYTPAEFIEAARAVLGRFDLDPASSEIANATVKADKIFTAETDGLSQDWPVGRIWMNPPYAQPLMGQFASKFAEAVRGGSSGIVLVNNATETAWFQTIAAECSAICFPRSRIRFLDPEGNPGAPLQGQAIVYCGNDRAAFRDAFSAFGLVVSHGDI